MKKIVIIISLILSIIMGVVGCNTAEETPKQTNLNLFDKEDAIEVDFKELTKDPMEHKGKYITFTGDVKQVQVDGKSAIIRLGVGGEFDFDSVVWIETSKEKVNDVLDGDYITVYGICTGTHTYTSQANYEITIPSMNGTIIEKTSIEEINEKESEVIFDMFDAINWEQVTDTKWNKKWEGIIKNHTDKDYEYISAVVKFTDDKGSTVATENIYIWDGLNAGENKHIELNYFNDKSYTEWYVEEVSWRLK